MGVTDNLHRTDTASSQSVSIPRPSPAREMSNVWEATACRTPPSNRLRSGEDKARACIPGRRFAGPAPGVRPGRVGARRRGGHGRRIPGRRRPWRRGRRTWLLPSRPGPAGPARRGTGCRARGVVPGRDQDRSHSTLSHYRAALTPRRPPHPGSTPAANSPTGGTPAVGEGAGRPGTNGPFLPPAARSRQLGSTRMAPG